LKTMGIASLHPSYKLGRMIGLLGFLPTRWSQ
jgi:hypothetical protein